MLTATDLERPKLLILGYARHGVDFMLTIGYDRQL